MPEPTASVSVQKRRYKGRGTPELSYTPEPWEEYFLKRYSTEGGMRLCAREAGTSYQHVLAWANKHPEFAEKLDGAREELVENLERMLVQMGKGTLKSNGFVPIIARLKGEQPEKYHDKLQMTGGFVNATLPVPMEALREIAAAMLKSAGGIIEVKATPIEKVAPALHAGPDEQEVSA